MLFTLKVSFGKQLAYGSQLCACGVLSLFDMSPVYHYYILFQKEQCGRLTNADHLCRVRAYDFGAFPNAD